MIRIRDDQRATVSIAIVRAFTSRDVLGALHRAGQRILAVAVFASAMHGCRRAGPSVDPEPGLAASTPSAAPDSVRGVLSLVGNEPGAVLVITAPSGGGDAVALRATSDRLLRAVVGLDVLVRGRRTDAREMRAGPRGAAVFDVASFIVRSSDGFPATDGIVVSRNDAFFLRLSDDTELRVGSLPAALRAKVGARVWIAGALSAPQAYGVIAERP